MSRTTRALVTGATGLLGRQVLKAFERAGYDVVGIGYSRASPPQIHKLDVQDIEAVSKFFDEVKPQVVVHCAADRQPDSCTQNPAAARKLNVTATSTLAKLCAVHKAFLIYISTDYVFSGQPGEAPYAANATPNPPNIYGETKLEGEQEILSATSPARRDTTQNPEAIILRVPVLYGETSPRENNKESAVNTIMDALWKANEKIGGAESEQQKFKMDDWAIRYPTNTADVARVCVDIVNLYTKSTSTSTSKSTSSAISPNEQEDDNNTTMKESPQPLLLPQILQFSSEDRMTKYEIMTKFAEIMGLSMTGVIANKDGGQPGPDGTLRPYDCHLSTSELRRLGVNVKTVGFVEWWRWYVGAFRK